MLATLGRRLRQAAARGASDDPRTLMGRAGGWLFVAGGTVGVISLAAPAGPGRDERAILLTALVAYALGVLELSLFDRFPLWSFQALTVAGTVLVSVALHYGGSASAFYRLLYFWVVLYAAYFFSPVEVALHLAVIAVSYAAVLASYGGSLHDVVIWFLLVATVAVAAALVIALRSRLERLLAGERERVERLRELDRLKDEVIATVSHELRTPLAAVYGAAVTLQRHDLGEERHAALLDVIHREAGRLARFVDAVLWTSRLDSARTETELTACPAVELAEEIADAARAHMPSNVTLAVRAPADVPSVAADADQLRQVLGNLVDNAVKYSPDGGRIDLTVQQNGRRVRFAVRDEGLGIPEEEQERIFERFHRLDPNLVRGVRGTGLGLHIARELVRRMAGDITVRSSPGAGSEFSFELPIAGEAEAARNQP